MLNQEQAQTELKKLENKEWIQTRLAAAGRLPEGVRDSVRIFLPDDKLPAIMAMQQRLKRDQQQQEMFGHLDAAARLELFEALAPGLGIAIEQGWQLLD